MKLTKNQAQVLIDAYDIDAYNDEAELAELREHNPELASACQRVLFIAAQEFDEDDE